MNTFAATDGSDLTRLDNIQPFGSLIIFSGKTYDKNQHQLRLLRQENIRFGLQNRLELGNMVVLLFCNRN